MVIFETAYDAYSTRLERKRSSLGDGKTMEGMSLNAAILLSLEFRQVEFLRRNAKNDHAISGVYTSLCVMEHQAWVRLSVLRRRIRVA